MVIVTRIYSGVKAFLIKMRAFVNTVTKAPEYISIDSGHVARTSSRMNRIYEMAKQIAVSAIRVVICGHIIRRL
jgi:hypothetical protein